MTVVSGCTPKNDSYLTDARRRKRLGKEILQPGGSTFKLFSFLIDMDVKECVFK